MKSDIQEAAIEAIERLAAIVKAQHCDPGTGRFDTLGSEAEYNHLLATADELGAALVIGAPPELIRTRYHSNLAS